jgi:S1-C subfamily serine protease
VRAGEPVLTIGSPYGFENTVTAGIVSAVPSALPDGNVSFIQTDVAVNPDNSGGPLFNRSGEVIGMNVQIYAQTERFQSLTFAIPINVATKVEAQLLAGGKVSQGHLGIGIQDIDPSLAGAFGLPRPAGALVNSVEPGTSAAASGIKPGDVVTQIGDKAIDRSAELAEHVAGLKPGTKAKLTLIRNRRPMIVTVMVGASEEKSGGRQDAGGTADRLGLDVHPLNDAERLASGLAEGLMVDGVYGPAASTSIHPGDIILSLNGTPVRSREQLGALTARAGKQVALLIQHDNTRVFVSVELR